MVINIFYSWISDYKEAHKSFIRSCIRTAIKKLEKSSINDLDGVTFKLIESLGNAPGHQVVSITQEEEIRNSDIFLGDWTVIDPYTCIERFRAEHFGYSRKRNVNPNVLHEYDCFTESNGHDGAILVMDASHGSAKEENEIIPVDLRGRRFPIEYCGEQSKENLINDIYNALKKSVPSVVKQRKNRFSPFHTWYEQNERASLKTPYYENEKLSSLKKFIKESSENLRIIGLSGIGKTRLVHETFKGEDDSFYRNNYLYVQYSDDEAGSIKRSVEAHIKDNDDCSILVVDNCPPRFARQILQVKNDYYAKNRIITLYNRQDQDSNDRVQDVEYVTISLEDVASVVDSILNGIYTQISEDKKKIIKDFSAGLPMMAVILAENVKKERVDFTTIPNNELVEKLLDTNDGQEKELLMSCAMFTHIGYRDERENESKFIICNSHITPGLSGDDCVKMTLFQRAFNKYTTREIFETQGRFFAIRPIPLALRLAEDWLSGCNGERLLNVISDIQKEDSKNGSHLLTSAFANQMAHLAGNPKAQKIVSIITGADSPFANAEVLNTELGSRLFRSFVEVNPVSVANLLWRVFGDMETEDLLNIKEGRRNLVWTIQKLCFDKRTFIIGAKLLIMFSLAENETWGNNATNESLNLFHVYLPGTEANLSQRLEIVSWVQNLDGAKDLFVKILSSALTCQHYMYFCGAESQGEKKLENYEPSSSEIIDYWSCISEILKDFTEKNQDKIELVSKIVTDNFMGLIRVGVPDIAFDLAEYVADKREWNWEDMRDCIRLMFWKESSKKYPDNLGTRLKSLQAKLTKNDFISKLKEVEHYVSENWEDETRRRNESYKRLASEYVTSEHASLVLLKDILNDSTIMPSLTFGKEIYNCIKDNKDAYRNMADTIIMTLQQANNPYNSILLGFLGHAGEEDFVYAYSHLRESMPEALYPLFAIRHKTLEQCSELFEMAKAGIADVKAFDMFCRYYDWSSASHGAVICFYEQLARMSSAGAEIAMERIDSMLYFDAGNGRFSFILDKYKDLIVNEVFPVQLDKGDYMSHVETLIDKYFSPEVAKFISRRLIAYYMSGVSVLTHNGHADTVLNILFDKYFDEVWADWSNALVKPENMLFSYRLQFKLGMSVGGLTGGALFLGDHYKELTQWCADYPDRAPILLAMYVPVYAGDSLSTLSKFLIDNYGNDKHVLSELSCNMNSFSCVGSAVPIYERKIHALQELVPHKNPTVNQWLQDNIRYAESDIAREIDRNAEDTILYR